MNLRTLFSRFGSLFQKARSEGDLATEMHAHLDFLEQENLRRGMSPEEARCAARREFGGLEQTKEAYRDQRGLPLLENFVQDLRFGARLLQKNPSFTAVAVLTLALGIGANSAAFSLLDAVLLKPLPYQSPERLFVVTETLQNLSTGEEFGVSAAEYFDYRDRNHCFSQVGAYEAEGFNLTGDAAPLRINAARLTASTFPMLGVEAILGRTFTPEEDREGAPHVAVLSYALWKSHYGGNPHVLGKTVKLDEQAYTVVGVMPQSFRYPYDGAPVSERADLWVPEAFTRDQLSERVREFGVHLIGRLKPEFTPRQAQADIDNVAASFMRQYPESYTGTIRVLPRVYGFARHSTEKARAFSVLLQAAVLCVLLIACANVANLLLAKAGHRSREMAVRRAIGADRARLLRQCMVESLLLSLFGGASGLLVASVLIDVARRFGPADVPQLQDVSLNAAAVAFALVVSLATTVFFGIVPAWRLSSVSPQESLKQTGQVGQMRGSQRLQNSLAIAEIAMALVLLIGGGLLLQSFARLLNVPLGFRPDGVIVARSMFDWGRYPNPVKREVAQKELLSRLTALPGVTSAAAASHLPLSDSRQIGFRLEHAAENDFHWAENSLVSPGYFHAMGIRLLRGRDFTEEDGRNAPNVAIVNEAFVRDNFGDRDPLGQRFYWGDRAIFTIVGVTEDVRVSSLDADPQPMVYDSMFQVESGASARTAFVLRVANADAATQQGILRAVQQQLSSVDQDLPLYGTTTLNGLRSESLAQRRFAMLLLSGFAGVALLLASVGLFGVLSYIVSQRRKELAMRMALGADGACIGRMVLIQGARLAILGCIIGLGLFALSSPLFGNPYKTSRFEPFTLTAISLLLFIVALFAAYWPARRAMKTDPLEILRYE